MKAMRREIEGTDVAAAPVVSEGGRSPSTLSTGLPGMTPNPSTIGPLAPGQRWSVGRKREVVLRLSPWSFCRGSLALVRNQPLDLTGWWGGSYSSIRREIRRIRY